MAQKRRPGGGRKKVGTGKSDTFSTRIDAALRQAIESEAADMGKNISTAAAILLRLGLQTRRDRQNDSPTRAFCYLIAELAQLVSNMKDDDGRPLLPWNENPFMFETLKLAIGRLMERLRPKGEIESPSERFPHTMLYGPLDTPERRAEHVVGILTHLLQVARPVSADAIFGFELPSDMKTEIERTSNAMWDARQALFSKVES